MREKRQYCHNLIQVPESRNERTHGFATTKIMEQLQLILDPKRTAGHVNLLQCHISRWPLVWITPGTFIHAASFRWQLPIRRNIKVLLEHIPIVDIAMIEEILGLVYRGKGT